MKPSISLDRCFTFINCQISPPPNPKSKVKVSGEVSVKRAVTLSRMTGAGSHLVAEKLAEKLQAKAPNDDCPWTIFDKNLVEKVLEDHKLPSRLARFMREDRILEISDTMDELFGLHPSSWTLVHKTAETILHLAELGNVIIIGRGSHVITNRLDHVFHVRLVGSVEKRLEHVQQHYKMEPKAAMDFLKREDDGRRRFLKKYFGRDIEDPLLYHLVINTDVVGYEEAAELIAEAVLRHPGRQAPVQQPPNASTPGPESEPEPQGRLNQHLL